MGLAEEPQIESTFIWKHAGKSYSTLSRHVGNSRVEFKDQGTTSFGEIIHILRIETQHVPVFIVRPFSPLTRVDAPKNPYSLYPYLKASVMYQHPQPLKAVLQDDLFGHSALVEKQAGTLNISLPTIFIVSLRSLVSQFFNVSSHNVSDRYSSIRVSWRWHQQVPIYPPSAHAVIAMYDEFSNTQYIFLFYFS